MKANQNQYLLYPPDFARYNNKTFKARRGRIAHHLQE